MNDAELRELMKSAFRGVTLDSGISLRQGEVCDNYGMDNRGRELSKAEFAAIPCNEITNDWTAIPLGELEQYPYLPYLDTKGFRYYIPAFLLSLLENAQGGSMRVISTLSSLFPTRDLWQHCVQRYELLDETQHAAIAIFLYHIQRDPRLDTSDQRLVLSALQAYWQKYLPGEHPH